MYMLMGYIIKGDSRFKTQFCCVFLIVRGVKMQGNGVQYCCNALKKRWFVEWRKILINEIFEMGLVGKAMIKKIDF